jgi:glutaredoxin
MIELYQKEECPFCAKVRQFLSDNHIDWIAHSAPSGSPARKKMVEMGGKEMVPFLYDPEKNITMYESDDIIEYLKENYIK